MKTIAVIPARGGSKAIPRKNIIELGGKPLISYIIEAALKVSELDRVVVSTEDEEIAEISKKYGAELPFIRPKELAKDETPTLPVLQHAVKFLEENENYFPDLVVLLYATFPLLDAEKISEAIKMIKENGFDSVISVTKDKGHYWIEDDNNYIRLYPEIIENRQLVKPLFKENGAIYACKRDLLIEKNQIVGGNIGFLVMNDEESVDINEKIDLDFAEFLLRKKYKSN
jgi:CMP-N,N'-diacetyllegionaminic acid synthase